MYRGKSFVKNGAGSVFVLFIVLTDEPILFIIVIAYCLLLILLMLMTTCVLLQTCIRVNRLCLCATNKI